MTQIEVPGSAPALGPYSKGMKTANLVFTSGQIGTSAGPDVEAQAEAACQAVGAVLAAGGAGFEQVVKTTCFLADINDFAKFNAVYAKYFVSKPARSCFAVKDLPGGALCEIEAIAVLE